MVEITIPDGNFLDIDWVFVAVIVSTFTALSTAGLAWIAWNQLGGLRRETSDAESDRKTQIEQLRLQVEATKRGAIDVLRPMLVVYSQTMQLTGDSGPSQLTLMVWNVGPGPALNPLFKAWLFPVDDSPVSAELRPGGGAALQSRADDADPHFEQVFAGMPGNMREPVDYRLPATDDAPSLWSDDAGTFLVSQISFANIFLSDQEPVGYVHFLSPDELRVGSEFLPTPSDPSDQSSTSD